MLEKQGKLVKWGIWALIFMCLVAGTALLLWYEGYRLKPVFTHWGYIQLVKWQTGIGACVGLVAILIGARKAYKNAQKHADEIRLNEARSIAAALVAEVTGVASAYTLLGRNLNGLKNDPTRLHNPGASYPALAAFEASIEVRKSAYAMYRATGPKIGYLPVEMVMHIGNFFGATIAASNPRLRYEREAIIHGDTAGLQAVIEMTDRAEQASAKLFFELTYYAYVGKLPPPSITSERDRAKCLSQLAAKS